MSEIGKPCGYCGTPDDGETWCCRLRYENGMDDPRRMGAWFQAEQAATASSGVTEGKAESGERALKSANEAYRELRAAVHSQLDASGIYMDGDAEDVITEALIEHAEADRKVSCPDCAQWSWHGPDAERKVIEHYVRAHVSPPAPEPPDAATVLAGLRESIQRRARFCYGDYQRALHEAIALVEAAQRRLADRGHGGGEG